MFQNFLQKDKFILKYGEFLITKTDTLINVLDKINNNKIHYQKIYTYRRNKF